MKELDVTEQNAAEQHEAEEIVGLYSESAGSPEGAVNLAATTGRDSQVTGAIDVVATDAEDAT